MAERSVLVVGAGVIGLCCAYYAARDGHRVIVVERGGPDHDCCSLGNAGMVVPSHFIPLAAPGVVGRGLRMLLDPAGPFAIRPRATREFLEWLVRFTRAASAGHVERSAPLLRELGLASRRAFDELADELPEGFGLTPNGLLMLCATHAALDEEAEVARMAEKLGVPAEVLSPAGAAKVDPDIRMEIAGAVYFPQDAYLDPSRLMSTLRNWLERRGVEFRWHSEVTGWRAASGRIAAAQTAAGELPADDFIVAGGAWSAEVLRPLGLRLPLQAGKGYSFTVPDPPQKPRVCSILTEARVAVTPMGGGLRFAGTMELSGNDLSINLRRVEGMRRAVPRYFPEFLAEQLREPEVWSGLRPVSEDGLPYLGRSRRYANLLVAAGHAMVGVSLAPVTGKLIADLLGRREPPIDIQMLAPER